MFVHLAASTLVATKRRLIIKYRHLAADASTSALLNPSRQKLFNNKTGNWPRNSANKGKTVAAVVPWFARPTLQIIKLIN